MNNGKESQKPSWEQLCSLAGFIVEFLGAFLNAQQVKYWLSHKTELKNKLREVFSIVDEYASIREEWQKFYKNHFGWDVDFNQVIIPQMPTNGKWRLLFIPRGMTSDIAYNTAGRHFRCHKGGIDSLNKHFFKNARDTKNHYAIWVRDEVVPDKEYLGKSVEKIDSEGILGITLFERIIFEIKYFTEVGNHLDVEDSIKESRTCCSGSRGGGDEPIPYVFWEGKGDDAFDGCFLVYGDFIDRKNKKDGIRSAVSL